MKSEKTSAAKHKAYLSKYIQDLKSKSPCLDCKISYPYYVMDFDHRDPSTKSGQISTHRTKGMKWVKAEIEKCDLVCANCHRIRTHDRGVDI